MAKILNVPRYTSGFCHALMKIYPAQYNQIFILRCTRLAKAKEQTNQPTVAEEKKHKTHSKRKGDMAL